MIENYTRRCQNENPKDRYLRDFFVTKILRDEDLRDYLCTIIAASLDLKREEIMDGFELCDIKIGSSKYAKDSEVDLFALTSKGLVNIEVNYGVYHEVTDKKNYSYSCGLVVRQIGRGGGEKDYKRLKPVYQINLNNYDQFSSDLFLYESECMEKNLHVARNDLQLFVDINMEKLKKYDYTVIKSMPKYDLRRLLYVFVNTDQKEIDEIYEGDDMMGKVISKLRQLDQSIDWIFVYDKEKLERQNYYAEGESIGFERGESIGFERGESIGFGNGQKKMIVSMFENGLPIKKIVEICHLPIEEVQNIINENINV